MDDPAGRLFRAAGLTFEPEPHIPLDGRPAFVPKKSAVPDDSAKSGGMSEKIGFHRLMFEPEPASGTVAHLLAGSPGDGDRAPVNPERLLTDVDSEGRKKFPMCSGLLDYFPDALAAVARVSFLGNEKHNPGEPLHHARGKSMDHADCIIRHLVERGRPDAEGNSHTAQMAWRALALLQEELENELGLPLPRGAR
jgi:hypothetical protein